ncbi:Uncharacterised protein [Escherichia coli]|nr:Uncharacterised protein [Escherichia coli]
MFRFFYYLITGGITPRALQALSKGTGNNVALLFWSQ